jgi:hypothetical protein
VRIVADSPMDKIRRIPDPRDQRGRRHRMPGLLGMMLMAAMQGERTLAGMWRWGAEHWSHLVRPLDLWGTPNPPTRATVLKLCRLLDPASLAEALGVPVPTTIEGIDEEHANHDDNNAQVRQILRTAGRSFQQSMQQCPMSRFNQYEALARFLCEVPLSDILGEPVAGASPLAQDDHDDPAESGSPAPQAAYQRLPHHAFPPHRPCHVVGPQNNTPIPLSEIQIMPDSQVPGSNLP